MSREGVYFGMALLLVSAPLRACHRRAAEPTAVMKASEPKC